MKPKSPIVSELDRVQASLAALLNPLGFSRKGRTLKRQTEPGVLQIVSLQAGPFEIGPPLPESFSHLREDYYGKFTVNLGVYVEEIHERVCPPVKPGAVISDAHCSIRTRLGHIADHEDRWWSLLEGVDEAVEEIGSLILHVAIPFLDRFNTREKIIAGWQRFNEEELSITNVARLDVAMVLLKQQDRSGATRLFQEHLDAMEQEKHLLHVRNHMAYVKELAAEYGIGPLL